jgi:hypothetical protein
VVNAAIIGLGWWGKNHLAAVKGAGAKLRFVHGVSKEIDSALPLAEAHGLTLSDDIERALADHGLAWHLAEGAALDEFIGDAAVLTDDFAPVDQLLTPYG